MCGQLSSVTSLNMYEDLPWQVWLALPQYDESKNRKEVKQPSCYTCKVDKRSKISNCNVAVLKTISKDAHEYHKRLTYKKETTACKAKARAGVFLVKCSLAKISGI